MRVARGTLDDEHPAAIIDRETDSVLVIREGVLEQEVILFLDNLLKTY